MPTTQNLRQEILNEAPRSVPLTLSRTVQNALYSTRFAFLQTLPAQLTLGFLPVAGGINVVNLYYRIKSRIRDKNTPAGEDVSLWGDVVSTGLEMTAIGLSIGVALGGLVLAAALIPVLFFAGLMLRWVDSFVQSIYWSVKVHFGEEGTKQQEEYRDRRNGNLRALAVLTAIALAVGFLSFSPIVFGFVVPAFLGYVIQGAATLITALTAVYASHEAYHIYKTQFQEVTPPLTLQPKQRDTALKNSCKLHSHFQSIDFAPVQTAAQSKTAAELCKRYQKGERFERLRENHIDDLLRKMETEEEPDGPYDLVLSFLDQAKKTLITSLGYQGPLELTNNFQLPAIKTVWWDHQAEKRKTKLHAVLLLEKLLYGEFNVEGRTIKSVPDILSYFKQAGQESKLFESLCAVTGATQKLFIVVDAYLTQPKFQFGTSQRTAHLDSLSRLKFGK